MAGRGGGRREGGGLSVLGDRWRGGLVHDGAGAGRAPCAVVGNRGPGWNVGGTLILSATVVLRHRSPLPPPICSFQRSYGKRSCAHMHAHKNIHRRFACTHVRTSASAPPPHTHTHTPLLICIFEFSCSAPASSPPPHHLTKLASRFD